MSGTYSVLRRDQPVCLWEERLSRIHHCWSHRELPSLLVRVDELKAKQLIADHIDHSTYFRYLISVVEWHYWWSQSFVSDARRKPLHDNPTTRTRKCIATIRWWIDIHFDRRSLSDSSRRTGDNRDKWRDCVWESESCRCIARCHWSKRRILFPLITERSKAMPRTKSLETSIFWPWRFFFTVVNSS